VDSYDHDFSLAIGSWGPRTGCQHLCRWGNIRAGGREIIPGFTVEGITSLVVHWSIN
jgi:hypothetical protein